MTTTQRQHPQPHITPREKLDFQLDADDIPRYWWDGDAFKTRFADAMSTTFPVGERFFISCVRDYRHRVKDPAMLREIKDFIRQEGQHGMVHDLFNGRLKQQGVAVGILERIYKYWLFDFFRGRFSRRHTLAFTAAAEHMTAIMVHLLFDSPHMIEQADPRLAGMYAWHAMEEMEHKAVAFDVMQKVAKVGYFTRILGFIEISFFFPLATFMVMNHMFEVDGMTRGQRIKTWFKGLWWLYGWGGLFSRPAFLKHYISYIKPGFHPWDAGEVGTYKRWLEVLDQTGDPIAAGQSLKVA
ncbi:MAG: metal-dependent hydrolase [Burkholderiales bacterium]|jgi:predicted metal-dependent hydrolase|nr:MAG: metal-dependent hydrolase [Burkholderiales bacterium]